MKEFSKWLIVALILMLTGFFVKIRCDLGKFGWLEFIVIIIILMIIYSEIEEEKKKGF